MGILLLVVVVLVLLALLIICGYYLVHLPARIDRMAHHS
jgi:hypothetical protein